MDVVIISIYHWAQNYLDTPLNSNETQLKQLLNSLQSSRTMRYHKNTIETNFSENNLETPCEKCTIGLFVGLDGTPDSIVLRDFVPILTLSRPSTCN